MSKATLGHLVAAGKTRTLAPVLMMALAGVLPGCTSPLADVAGDWLETDPPQWQARPGQAIHHRQTLVSTPARPAASPDASTAAPIPWPFTGTPDVEDYVSLALQRNPSILAAQRRIDALTQRIALVESLDDPMFQVAPFGQMAETAAGQVSLMTGLSQKLPYPGKLALRGRIAEQDVAIARQDLQQVRLDVAARTRQAFWSYCLADWALAILDENRRLLEQFKQTAQALYRAGSAAQSDVLRASVELSRIDDQRLAWSQRRASAAAMLNQLLDRPPTAPLPAPPPPRRQPISLDLDRLLAQAARHNPALTRLHQRIEKHRRQRDLARLDRRPDLTIGLAYNVVDDSGLSGVANGQDQWWLSFGVNLPVWSAKYDAAERQAIHQVLQGVADLTAEQNRVAYRVQDAYFKTHAQQQQVRLFADLILPQARQTVEASLSGYRSGKVDFLTLIDNWRKQLDYELLYQQNLSQLEQNFAELQRAVGRDLPRTPAPAAPMRPQSRAYPAGKPTAPAGSHGDDRHD